MALTVRRERRPPALPGGNLGREHISDRLQDLPAAPFPSEGYVAVPEVRRLAAVFVGGERRLGGRRRRLPPAGAVAGGGTHGRVSPRRRDRRPLRRRLRRLLLLLGGAVARRLPRRLNLAHLV